MVGPGDHPLPEESVHLHEPGLDIERVVAETQCVRTQHGRHRQQLDVESLALEVCPIGVDDLTPVGIQVGFGDQAGDGRAQRHHLAKERDLGLGELLACVGHHKNRVCRGDQPESACGMRVPVPTDAGGVDQHQAVGQQRAGDVDLEPGDVASLGQRVVGGHGGELVHRQRGAHGVTARLRENQFGGRLLPVLHESGHGGGLVVADRTHLDVQQGIDELALALLERPHHDDPYARIGDPGAGSLEPVHQVLPSGLGSDLTHPAQQLAQPARLSAFGCTVGGCGRRSGDALHAEALFIGHPVCWSSK